MLRYCTEDIVNTHINRFFNNPFGGCRFIIHSLNKLKIAYSFGRADLILARMNRKPRACK